VSRFKLNTVYLPLPALIKKPAISFFIHWIGWILLYFITYIPSLINSTKINWEGVVFNYVVLASINFILFYLVAFILLPFIGIDKKRWIWLIVICLTLAFAFCFAKFRLEIFRAEKLMVMRFDKSTGWILQKNSSHTEPLGVFSYRFRNYLQLDILNTISIIFIAFAYRLLLAWYMQEKIRKDLENQKLRAELSYLKMQMNPHFLFNALNNIYSLAISEKGKKTGDSIMKLSELLRYVLYEKEDEQNKVSLEKEIKHINSYIDLVKLRYENGVYINFSIEGDTSNKRIAPLLLFPLIENASKHGVMNDPKKPTQVDLNVSDSSIRFTIKNYKNNYLKDETGGIGIQNVQKRLDLLYPNQYTLKVDDSGDQFIVDLQLPL